jgi:type II secretory pathway pseudopilin PulG
MNNRRPHRQRPGRAFTLIEVVVAMVLSIIILGVCTTIMVNTLAEGRRTRTHSEMARDASLTAQLFAHELRQAGLGIPSGGHINAAYGSSANDDDDDDDDDDGDGDGEPGVAFYASLLVAGSDQIGITGDFPRADASYNAFGPLHNRTVSNGNVAWHTENNGSCVVDADAGSCSTAVGSVFFPGEAGCNTSGTSAFGDRTCPWGMRRVVPGERLIIVSGDGRWAHAAMSTVGTIDATGPLNVLAARLSPGYSPADWPNPPSPSLPVTTPNETAGQGFVATIDRIFFRYDSATRTIERMQCSGDPDPDHPSWPNQSATAIPTTPAFTPTGGAAQVCGPFEIIARHVESLTFTYLDGSGAVVPLRNSGILKRSIRRVNYRIEFRHTLDGRDVTHDVAGSVRLQNL